MLNYKISEEITRWVFEVYVKTHGHLNWWIAFTNPTAGPWKKIIATDHEGISHEIHRFEKEEERPDLILVNDPLKAIIISEAKDFVEKLINYKQMDKSFRVIKAVSEVLQECEVTKWQDRRNYKIIPSFLWFCRGDIEEENKLVLNSLNKISRSLSTSALNVIINKEASGMIPRFYYKGKIHDELDFEV